MILDHLSNWRQYATNEAMTVALEFLQRPDLAELAPGRHPIMGEGLYAVVLRDEGRGRESVRLEAHRKCIDIHLCLAGHEVIGWKATAECRSGDGSDEPSDAVFFKDPPSRWLELSVGSFAVFFPADAHAALAGAGPVHKVIVKVPDAG